MINAVRQHQASSLQGMVFTMHGGKTEQAFRAVIQGIASIGCCGSIADDLGQITLDEIHLLRHNTRQPRTRVDLDYCGAQAATASTARCTTP